MVVRCRARLLLALVLACHASAALAGADPPAAAPDPAPLPTLPIVRVEDTRLVPERHRSDEAAREELRRTPGGVALVSESQIRQTRASSFDDVLSGVPGVLVRSRGTGEEPQLSIRGSSLRNNFHNRGVNVILDGFPFQNADGFSDFESFELLAARRVEVLKGLSSMRFGGNTLGGAIQIVGQTGREADLVRLRSEAGSFGFARSFASTGLARGPWDGFLAVSDTRKDGYRDHSDQDRQRLVTSFGRSLEGGGELRVDANAVRNRQQLPGALTRSEYSDDASQAQPASEIQEEARDYEFGRTAVSLQLPLGDGTRLDWLGQFHYQDLWHPLAFGIIDNDTANGSTELRLVAERAWLGFEHALSAGVQLAGTRQPQQIHVNDRGSQGPTFSDQVGKAWNTSLYAVDDVALSPSLSLVGALRLQYAGREIDDRTADDTDHTNDVFATPSLGAVWRFASDAELYGGAGYLVEPPLLLEAQAPGNLAGNLSDLKPQRAWQFELGVRGSLGERLAFDAAVYDVEVRDEIRNVNVDPTGLGLFTIPRYENLDETRHFGVELGLDALLLRDLGARVGLLGEDTLHWITAWTFSRNTFVDDPTFGDNDLPGVPNQIVHSELRWRHDSGVWIAPSLEVAAGDWYADSENDESVPSALIWNLRAGFDHARSGLSLFVEARNLADRKWVSAVVVDTDNGRFLEPGDGRGVSAGLEWRWR